jgi:hypothetical protein
VNVLNLFDAENTHFSKLKHVELLGSLSKGSRFLIVKNPLITLPMVSPRGKSNVAVTHSNQLPGKVITSIVVIADLDTSD